MRESRFREARPDDAEALHALQAAYYEEDGYAFDRDAARRAWQPLIEGSVGRVWVAESEGRIVAYAVLTLGHSLEYGGRDAFVDELYVTAGWRGRGLGTEALDRVEAACRELGVRALHLEVERDKTGAQALYRRRGFRDSGRLLMSRRFSPDSDPPDEL